MGINSLSEVLSDYLLQCLLIPQFVASLIPENDQISPIEDQISPLLSVFLLSQVFFIFSYKPLINSLAAALIHTNPATYSPNISKSMRRNMLISLDSLSNNHSKHVRHLSIDNSKLSKKKRNSSPNLRKLELDAEKVNFWKKYFY